MPRLFIKTFGCQMNVYDSARMRDALAVHGFKETDKPEKADVLLLNTCHIREKASEKLFSECSFTTKARPPPSACLCHILIIHLDIICLF